jgi:lipopolysaccharide/colanic/teichoic acid biosynthesis glycosyltransferase
MVDRHYAPVHRETLRVRPGLASPGSIYNLTHGERLLDGADPEGRYVAQLLPLKVALDVVYVRHRSMRYDAALIGRTMWVVGATLLGRRDFPEPPEADEARRLLAGI